MDAALANALKRQKELLAELEQIEQFLALHKRFAAPESAPVKRKRVSRPRKRMVRSRPDDFVSLMETALRRNSAPMTRGQLAAAVEHQGVRIPSADKAKYLGTILWRNSQKFENIEGKGYWLRGVPLPTTPKDMIDLLVGQPSVGGNRS